MKKLIFSAAVLASAFFAASCQQEMLDPQAEGTTVTYTVEVPDAIATKATGDGFTLHYEVYRQGDLSNLDADPIYAGTKEFSGGKADVQLEFVKDQEFYVLFWAQKGTPQAYDITDLRKVSLNTLVANDLTAEVFAGNDHVSDCKSDKDGNVTLVRPVAQLNIATTADSFTLGTTGSTVANVVPTKSKVVVNGLYGTYNVADGTVGTKASRTYTEANVPGSDFKSTYKLMATNYLGFIPQAGDNVEVTFTIYTENDGNIEHTVSNVPVKANYQTNILGNLISATADYQVTLEDWADAGKDMQVLADGIVKNINGDYEISTAVGFAYAINELFADGGTFYIHPGTYDFTGLVVVPKPTKPGAILNVKANEVPVVTRSTSGFEIIGLDVAYLVSEVSNGSQAIFSNLVLPEDTKLVGENNGVVGVSGCSNEETDVPADLIGDNKGEIVNTVSMASVDEINAAIAQGLKLIELTGDVTEAKTLSLTSSVIIDGNGYTWTYTGNARAITVEKNEDNIDLTVKNLTVNCNSSYCQRGVNFNTTGSLTLNNVIVSGENITYAVNFPGSSDESNVTITDSYLRGNIALNVWGEKMTINATNTEFVSYDANAEENYAAISLNNDGSSIANETTVNITDGKIIALDENGEPSNAVRNSTMTGEVVVSETTEVVGVVINPVAAVVYEGYNEFYSCTTLQKAIDKVCEDNNGSVRLIKDITVSETVVVPADETVVIDLNGKTLEGTMPKSVGHVLKNEGTLTLKNGTISSTGANGGSAIYNAGTLTVQNATLNGSSIRENEGWPSYPVNNYSDATLENVTVTGYQGAIAANAPGTTTVTNCTINKEYLNTSSHVFYINHADAEVVVNGGTYTHKGMDGSLAYVIKGRITVNGGTFSASNGGYGMAPSKEGVIEVYGGDFTASFLGWGGTINIMGGTFASKPADAHLADGYKAVQNAETGKWEVVEKTYVAQVGDKKYESLQEAFATVQDDQTITFLSNVEQADGVILTDKNITVDLNGKTFTVSEGASTNNRNFKINGSSVITIKNGTMIAAGEYSSGAYGTLRTEGSANVTLTGVKLYNYRGNGLNVKALSGTTVEINNTEIYSEYGGGVEAAGGTVELTNVKVEQKGMYTAPYNSMAISVNGGGTVTVNSGTYSTECITAEEANNQGTSHGPWCAGVLNSGGTLIIKGGTFSNDNFGENSLATYARGLLLADTGAKIEINGGTFNALAKVIDIQNNLGDASKNPKVLLADGNYSSYPLTWDGLISVVEGKGVVEGADGRWTIQ